ncbi:hypothetical protein, partial [Pseudomonas sp. PS02290]|uniref:hypothetical protein n=1 Tax=Pseudomonas sp. PS02290 TaxID=2991430 RepID=UPI00249BE7AA
MLAVDLVRATDNCAHPLFRYEDDCPLFRAQKTKPHLLSQMGFWNLILTMTYSHMGKPHTTIGDASFH